MEQFKRVQVVMLPTKEYTSLILMTNNLEIRLAKDKHFGGQHLYFLSDDKIETNPTEGEYFYHIYNKTIVKYQWKVSGLYMIIDSKEHQYSVEAKDLKKIIATTDTFLLNPNINTNSPLYNLLGDIHKAIPQPSEQFIEKYVGWYNANKPITEVLVEYDFYIERFGGKIKYGKPTFHPYKKEISKLKVNPKDNTITIKRRKDSWNREEVIELLGNARLAEIRQGQPFSLEQWINKNL